MRKAIQLALIGLLSIPLSAQDIAVRRATIFYNYNVSTAGYTYATFSSDPTINIDPLNTKGVEVTQAKKVATVGSSTTITAVAATSPFLGPQAGDLLIFVLPSTAINLPRVAIAAGTGEGERVERLLTTHTSDDIAVVDAAIDLGTSGVGFYWKKFITGTAAGSAWIPVGSFKSANFKASVTTLNATSLDFTVDCKGEGPNALPNQVFTKNFTSATYPANTTAVAVALEYAQYRFCRAGWKINTDTGAQSVQTDVELTR